MVFVEDNWAPKKTTTVFLQPTTLPKNLKHHEYSDFTTYTTALTNTVHFSNDSQFKIKRFTKLTYTYIYFLNIDIV